MALFGFFKTEKPVRFTYRPRFYDDKKEAFQERMKESREMGGKDPEAVKSRIRRDLRRKSSYLSDKKYRQQKVVRSNIMLLLVIVVLIVVTYAALELYLPMLLEYLQ